MPKRALHSSGETRTRSTIHPTPQSHKAGSQHLTSSGGTRTRSTIHPTPQSRKAGSQHPISSGETRTQKRHCNLRLKHHRLKLLNPNSPGGTRTRSILHPTLSSSPATAQRVRLVTSSDWVRSCLPWLPCSASSPSLHAALLPTRPRLAAAWHSWRLPLPSSGFGWFPLPAFASLSPTTCESTVWDSRFRV